MEKKNNNRSRHAPDGKISACPKAPSSNVPNRVITLRFTSCRSATWSTWARGRCAWSCTPAPGTACPRAPELFSRCARDTVCRPDMARVSRPDTRRSWWLAPGTARVPAPVAVRRRRPSCTPVWVWHGWSRRVARSPVRVRKPDRIWEKKKKQSQSSGINGLKTKM